MNSYVYLRIATGIVRTQDLMNVSGALITCSSSPPFLLTAAEIKSTSRGACVKSETERQTERNGTETGRGQTYSSLPWIHWLSHCRWRAFFMLHCNTVLLSALFFMTLLPKDVGVLRRPLTVINITGCRYRLTFESLLLRHRTSASFLMQRVTASAARHATIRAEGMAVSGIFKPPSGSLSIYFSFCLPCLLPLFLLLSLTASFQFTFSLLHHTHTEHLWPIPRCFHSKYSCSLAGSNKILLSIIKHNLFCPRKVSRCNYTAASLFVRIWRCALKQCIATLHPTL